MSFAAVPFNAVAARLHPSRADLFAKSPVNLAAIRGANPDPGHNPFARYDDVILACIRGVITQWVASTDPSWALVVHPVTNEGAAQLRPGIHLFRQHLMHAGTPREHPCLGQAEEVAVNRLDSAGRVVRAESGQFGICIHSGGEGMETGRFSAGCQIIQNNDGYFCDPTWSRFWLPVRDAMNALGLKTVPYLLLNKSDL